VYGKPLQELLPAETVWLTDKIAARRDAILYALERGSEGMPWSAFKKPGFWHRKLGPEWSVDALYEAATRLAGRELARWPLDPNARGDHRAAPDEAETKAAKRLDTTPEYVAYTARE